MTKKIHSFSLDVELTELLKMYPFVNWSEVVNDYFHVIMDNAGTDLEKLRVGHEKIQEIFKKVSRAREGS